MPVVDGEKHLVGVVSKKDLEKPGVRSNLILSISASPAIAAEKNTSKLWVVECCSAISPAVTLFLIGCEAMTSLLCATWPVAEDHLLLFSWCCHQVVVKDVMSSPPVACKPGIRVKGEVTGGGARS